MREHEPAIYDSSCAKYSFVMLLWFVRSEDRLINETTCGRVGKVGLNKTLCCFSALVGILPLQEIRNEQRAHQTGQHAASSQSHMVGARTHADGLGSHRRVHDQFWIHNLQVLRF